MAFLLNSSHIYFVWSISRFSTTRAIDFQPRTLGRQCEFTRAHDSRTNACKVVDRLAVHWWQSRQNSNNNEDIENYAKTKEHTVNIIKISSNALPLIDLVISGVETYITQLCCCYYYCYYIILSLLFINVWTSVLHSTSLTHFCFLATAFYLYCDFI